MISLIDVVRLIKNEFPGSTVYPLEFPLDAPESAIVVEMSSNVGAKAEVFNMSVQVKVREPHPTYGEKTCYAIRSFLENKTNFNLGSVQVVLVKSQNPVPLYMGKDGAGNHMYSNNFRFTINEGVSK